MTIKNIDKLIEITSKLNQVAGQLDSIHNDFPDIKKDKYINKLLTLAESLQITMALVVEYISLDKCSG